MPSQFPTTQNFRMNEEDGTTHTSSWNGTRLRERGEVPCRVELVVRPGPSYVTRVFFESGSYHEFLGFSWGFRGEGPRGLAQWTKENKVPLRFQQVTQLPKKQGVAWVWPPNKEKTS